MQTYTEIAVEPLQYNPLILQTNLGCMTKPRYINQLWRAYYTWWLLVDQI